MKKLVITATALATLVATPALAQNYRTRAYAAPLASNPYYDSYSYYMGAGTTYGAGYEAYASVPGGDIGSRPGIYNYGHYLGWDPDPNIRFQLLRDPFGGD